MDVKTQNLMLIFVQQAAVDLPGMQEFFWLDGSEAAERYRALRAAYKTSSKFKDVYLKATEINYKGETVPIFHMAVLLQNALRLIEHDRKLADGGDTRPV